MSPERLDSMPQAESIDRQEAIIRSSITPQVVFDEYRRHFTHGSIYEIEWEEAFRTTALTHREILQANPDYFRLVALTNTLGAQYGFESMEGQFLKRTDVSSFDPRREFALACHLARLNTRAHPIKEKLSHRYERHSEAAAIGIWGLPLPTKYLRAADQRFPPGEAPTVDEAFDRFHDKRPVVVPNAVLNTALAEIDFPIEKAVEIEVVDFKKAILPQLVAALGDLLDPEYAFFRAGSDFIRFYSTPQTDPIEEQNTF